MRRMGRYDLTDSEWRVIEPLLPNKPRGVPRGDDRRVLKHLLGSAIRCQHAHRYGAGPETQVVIFQDHKQRNEFLGNHELAMSCRRFPSGNQMSQFSCFGDR